MKKIQYAIVRKETGNASGKAKRDAYDIALKHGFVPSYHPSNKQVIRILQQIFSLYQFRGNKIIFFQYPAVSEQLMEMFKKVVTPASYKIALIHDLSSIQGIAEYAKNKEASYLSIFDCLIVHNEKMKQYVMELGYKGNIVVLGLFDYLHDVNYPIQSQPFSNSIAFAGNLDKAKFLHSVGQINCNWVLYGSKGNKNFDQFTNLEYKGLLPSDKIQYLMEGDYGLVWDGDSIDTCSGSNGEYLRFNNPQKVSCCIAAGKPIITWKQAAIAEFIQKNHIGITVDSLKELNEIDLASGYKEMRENVISLKKKIAEGVFLDNAIAKALEFGDI